MSEGQILGKLILLVEDDEATAELERRALNRAGLQVRIASRVSDALSLLQTESFSAVLLDYNLPDGDALLVAEAARFCVPRVPVILVTGMGSEAVAIAALQSGVVEYVKKAESYWEELPQIVKRVTRFEDPAEWVPGNSVMAQAIRELDWSQTAIGAMETWPLSIRSPLSICLTTGFPMAIYWGPSFVLLYNDLWASLVGNKHPGVLGRNAQEVWGECWDVIEPLLQKVMETGEAMYAENALIPMERNGFLEECYFNYSLSPIRGPGGRIDGLFNAIVETSALVISEGRARLLGELNRRLLDAQTITDIVTLAAKVLVSESEDIVFGAIYLTDLNAQSASLAQVFGIPSNTTALPANIQLNDNPTQWPLEAVRIHGEIEVIRFDASANINHLGTALPNNSYTALVLPLSSAPTQTPTGFIILGLNPRRSLDEVYREFAAELAWHIASALENSIAYVNTISEVFDKHTMALANALPHIVWTANPNGERDYFNRHWFDYTGMAIDQLKDSDLDVFVHPEDLKRVNDAWADACKTGAPYEIENRLKRASDGMIRWHLTRALPVHDHKGKIIKWFGTCTDIHDQKQAYAVIEKTVKERTAELAQSEQRFRGAFETAALGMALVSTKGRWLRVNSALCAMVGYVEHELLSIDFQTITHPDDLAKDLDHVRALLDGKIDTYQMEKRYFHKNGDIVWVLLSVSLVRSSDGTPVHFVSQIQDISAQKATLAALQEAMLVTEMTKERFAIATESGAIGIWDWNLGEDSIHCDALMYQLYGLAPQRDPESLDTWLQRIHRDDQNYVAQALDTALKGGAPYNLEFRNVWPDGSIHNIRATAHIKRDANGTALRMIGANWDVTESRRLTTELAEQHELLEVTLHSIGDAVITTDVNGLVRWINPVAEKLTGWSNTEAMGQEIAQVFCIVNESTREPVEDPTKVCLAEGKIVGLANHTVLISRDGCEFGIEDSAAPIHNDSGQVLGVILVFRDVTEKRRLSGEISYRATHDALTGLVNRIEFDTQLRLLLNNAHEERSEHALMYIDLDQFKLVNDSCGHAIGDQLLQQVSKLLSSGIRDHDMLARLGGDEFAIILQGCSAAKAQRAAQQICDRMDDFRFMHDEKRFRIGASIGLVPIDNRWTSTEAIMQAADTSCYAAKEAGRNRVHAWFDSDSAIRTRHGEMQWTDRIGNALDESKFILYAQRIIPLNGSNDKVHAEVLLRMLEHDGTLIPPSAFLPAAERFHLASRIDRWVLTHALDWMKAAPSLDAITSISINLSGQSIGDLAFHRWATELLIAAGTTLCQKLCIEITETAVVTNLADAERFIDELHAIGIKIALDDFGSGVSSFGYLKSLSIDFLKIDGQFIKGLMNNPLDDVAVRCFAEVAHVIGIQTVAEFVEQEDVLERLKAIGVDYAQGFLKHRPEPIDALLGTDKTLISLD